MDSYEYGEEGVNLLLRLLEKYNNHATFFVLQDFVRNNEALLQRMVERGNEIGCHGYSHIELYNYSPKKFEEEFAIISNNIEKCTKKRPIGYRAPRMSLNEETKWLLPIIHKYDYKYDASIYPAKTGSYGNNCAPIYPYKISFTNPFVEDSKSPLLEFPGMVRDYLFLRLPVKLRFMGYSYVKKSIKKMNKLGHPAVFIIHPWELISMPTYINNYRIPMHVKLFRNFRIPCIKYIEKLLKDFKFITIEEYLNNSE